MKKCLSEVWIDVSIWDYFTFTVNSWILLNRLCPLLVNPAANLIKNQWKRKLWVEVRSQLHSRRFKEVFFFVKCFLCLLMELSHWISLISNIFKCNKMRPHPHEHIQRSSFVKHRLVYLEHSLVNSKALWKFRRT